MSGLTNLTGYEFPSAATMESGPPQRSNSRNVADRLELIDRVAKLKEAALKPDWAQTLRAEGSPWLSKFAIGDKVDQAFSNHPEGTLVASFTDRADDCRYAVELFGHQYRLQTKGSRSRQYRGLF
jgi:hypothetical protein